MITLLLSDKSHEILPVSSPIEVELAISPPPPSINGERIHHTCPQGKGVGRFLLNLDRNVRKIEVLVLCCAALRAYSWFICADDWVWVLN